MEAWQGRFILDSRGFLVITLTLTREAFSWKPFASERDRDTLVLARCRRGHDRGTYTPSYADHVTMRLFGLRRPASLSERERERLFSETSRFSLRERVTFCGLLVGE